MKKILIFTLVFALLVSFALPVMAKKPSQLPEQANQRAKENFQNMLQKLEERQVGKDKEKNDEGKGVDEYSFYLAGDVMPAPYGENDIEGSDLRSKLLVNTASQDSVANIVGQLKGLDPLSEYTVYLSNGYEPYGQSGWSILGDFEMAYEFGGGIYYHTMSITSQEDGVVMGYGGHPITDPVLMNEVITGTIDGDTVNLRIEYTENDYFMDVVLTINPDGSLSGTWSNDTQAGTVTTYSGVATMSTYGDTSWPGMLSANIAPVSVLTNEEGDAEFAFIILEDDVEFVEDELLFSVWVNSTTTILISDTVTLTK